MKNLFFDKNSNVTVVITSCDRFPLLAATLSSFDTYNSYPINKIIIIEDSGNHELYKYIPKHWAEHCQIIINEQKLGQIKSIDLAYSYVETEYIFHCEDDWVFYRDGFIEDSLKILKQDSSILQVWLRSFENDVSQYYPFHSLGIQRNIDGIEYHDLESSHDVWKGFSFNPGLRRLKDYLKIAPFVSIGHEAEIAIKYHSLNYYSVILKNNAVSHIGWDSHVDTEEEIKYKQKLKKLKKLKHITIGFILGSISTLILYTF